MNFTRKLMVYWLIGLMATVMLVACGPAVTVSKNGTALAEELTIYGWEGYMPQSVLDAFTTEYGVAINYIVYGSAEEATAALRQGEVFDIVVLDNVEVEIAAQENLLAQLDHRNLPNFQHVASNFRDLAVDPKNTYSVPFEWGTSGLLFRTDQIDPPLTTWADLWNPAYTGKIGLWPYDRDVVGLTLQSLGYSYSSEEPEELAQAGARLMELSDRVILLDPYLDSGVPYLLDGRADIIFGWAYDMQMEAEGMEHVTYVLPEEGSIIWMDNLVIPAASPDQDTAELFLNFIMRPQIAAQIANELYVAVPNEGAYEFIAPDILTNPLIFPTRDELADAEFYTSISQEAQAIYAEIWAEFVNTVQP